MVTNCPVCGKKFHVQYPHLWVYREDGVHICTWKCLRKIRREKEEKMAEELKNIEEPTPKKRGRKPKAKEEAPVVKLSGPIRIEAEEPEKVEVVEMPAKKVGGLCPPPDEDNEFIFQTVAVRNKKLGTFYYDEKHGTIDWRHPNGEEISLYPEDYRLLRDSIDMILHTLGVKP